MKIDYFIGRIYKLCLINIDNFLRKSAFKFVTCLLDSLSLNSPLLCGFLYCIAKVIQYECVILQDGL